MRKIRSLLSEPKPSQFRQCLGPITNLSGEGGSGPRPEPILNSLQENRLPEIVAELFLSKYRASNALSPLPAYLYGGDLDRKAQHSLSS